MPYPDAFAADYLLRLAQEPILQVYYERRNEPMEISELRLILERQGIKADHENHWGLLTMRLLQRGMIEQVGRAPALARTRHNAKNNLYRLTPAFWQYVEKVLAAARGWSQMAKAPDSPSPPTAQAALFE